MTDEELKTLVASLATSTANNVAEARANTEAIRELRTTMTEGFESQARSIESLRESITYNIDTMASALELAAASQQTAAAAMELSAQTSRNLDRLEQDIADLKNIVGIVIRDNQADRGRITKLEEQ